MAQQRVISGKVTDESGGVLPGVNILLKGTSLGTVSDQDGVYSLSIPENTSASGVLVFSFIGYLSEEVTINQQTSINMQMMPDIQTLNEVVVVGYGTQDKKEITGAVSSVKTKDLPKVASTSIDNLLQGRAAGLNLSQRSAQPGGGLNINIRGSISPNGNNAPLYVIDGVPIQSNNAPEPAIRQNNLGYNGGVDRSPLNTLNPSDIESIDILKDASATAIYGAAAANGVILITTKKGKAGEVTTEYRGSYTVQTPKKYYDMMNATDFMQQHERLAYDRYLYTNNLAPYGNDDPGTKPAYIPMFSESDIAGAGAGTDWLDMVMRNGSIQEHNVSLSGGNEKQKIFTSFNYYNNKAILENSDFLRYTGRMNVEQELGGRVKANLNMTFSQINSNNASSGSNNGGVEAYNMLQAAYAFSPTIGVYDNNGNYTRSLEPQISNPASFFIIKDKSVTKRFFLAPSLEVKILDNLKANVVVGIDNQSSQRNFYLPKAAGRTNLQNGMANLNTARIGNYSGEGYLTYTRSFGQSDLSVLAGGGYYKTFTDGFGLEAVDFFTDAFQDNNVGVASNRERNNLSSYRNERVKLSQYVRINYSFADKYLFTFNGRRDGQSYFAKNQKYGFFPGASLGWRISEEDFLKSSQLVSDLKLRVGYGAVGNEILSGNALDLYSAGQAAYVFGNTQVSGVAQSQVANPNLTWETDVTANIGIDFGLWGGRLTGSLDVFRKTAKDLLDYFPLPSNNAVGRVAANVGKTRSDGIELDLRSNNISTSDFTWTTTFNISHYKNYWVERNTVVAMADYIGGNDRIREIYGWKTDGIIKSVEDIPTYMPNARVGNIKYVDVDGSGTLDSKDVVKLGSYDPKFNVGLGNTITYKNFDLNIFFYGFLGRQIFNNYAGLDDQWTKFFDPNRVAIINAQNSLVDTKNIWSASNPDGTLPGVASNPYAGANPSSRDDFYLEDGSFVRLKNITLGYNFPAGMFGNSRFIKSGRIFLDLQNVAVFTRYKGYDPEFTQRNPYPQALSTTLGVNLSF
jgi:TonB-linked SusC/RagA family outer membrane protein